MIKRRDLLDGYFLPAGAVQCGADNPVGSLSDEFQHLVLLRDIEVDFLGGWTGHENKGCLSLLWLKFALLRPDRSSCL